MFNFIRKLFGQGFIYADFVCDDGTKGRVKAPFTGDPETFDQEDYIKYVKSEIYFKHNKRVVKVSNISVIEK